MQELSADMKSVKSDAMTILLCYYINQDKSKQMLCKSIKKCLQAVRDRTNDKDFRDTCRHFIKAYGNKQYDAMIDFVHRSEAKFYESLRILDEQGVSH